MEKIIAVDLGGTNVRAAFFPSPQPPYTEIIKIPTESDQGADHIVDRIVTAVRSVMPEGNEPIRIGLGSPGPLDPARGVILNAPNLKGFIDFPLRDRLQERLNCPIAIGNDADMACLGEWGFGAGRGTRNMIYMTISTGIGGGIVVNGQLITGGAGLAGEIGHMTMEPDGPMCGCGHRGHLETLSSGPSIARSATERIRAGEDSSLRLLLEKHTKLSAEDVSEAAASGDALAIAVIAKAGYYVGLQISNLAHALNPEAFILGGGVTNMGELFMEPVRQSVKKNILHSEYLKTMKILPAMLGDDAGIIGAMVLAAQQ